MKPVISVVIPAHNEEAVVAAGLDLLLAGAGPGEFDVVVVANGCSDGTAAAAARPGVRVLETPVAGKAGALRLGDAACRTFPRAYVDADVRLDAASLRALAETASRPGVLACAPVPEWDLDGTGPVVRRVHRVHDRLIAPTRALAGVGVYVLAEKGHERAFPLPDVISDDGWVDGCFTGSERVVVTAARSVVRPRARSVRTCAGGSGSGRATASWPRSAVLDARCGSARSAGCWPPGRSARSTPPATWPCSCWTGC
ncbi:Glycosyl transferase, group 2 family protein [[Actinomadura] parvosata subsp. kistnae]|uniref:glycosyltransferase n=1 Tax=[Actinomadura] parvosata TaxID=1955412 RepID=UPI000D2BFE3C|nr:Glycosyl transferase, group 2 family protein [Actinomadura parvosata subsp. kistnae]